jgi:hypothetical protein
MFKPKEAIILRLLRGAKIGRRDKGKRFVVYADEKLTAFMELESTIRAVSR